MVRGSVANQQRMRITVLLRFLILFFALMSTCVGPGYAQTGASSAADDGSSAQSNAGDGAKGPQWEMVHEVDILLPKAKKVFGRVEVMLDRNSVEIKEHEVYYRVRIYRTSETSDAETLEQRVSDCRAGRYRLVNVTDLRTGKQIAVDQKIWRKPRQSHVQRLERYVCEKVCGIGYPDAKKPGSASCLAR